MEVVSTRTIRPPRWCRGERRQALRPRPTRTWLHLHHRPAGRCTAESLGGGEASRGVYDDVVAGDFRLHLSSQSPFFPPRASKEYRRDDAACPAPWSAPDVGRVGRERAGPHGGRRSLAVQQARTEVRLVGAGMALDDGRGPGVLGGPAKSVVEEG